MLKTLESPIAEESRLESLSISNNNKFIAKSQELLKVYNEFLNYFPDGSVESIIKEDYDLHKPYKRVFYRLFYLIHKTPPLSVSISYSTLAKRLNLSPETVSRALTKLKEREYITYRRRGNKPNAYQVNYRTFINLEMMTRRTSDERATNRTALQPCSEQSHSPPSYNYYIKISRRLTSTRYIDKEPNEHKSEQLVSFLNIIKEKGVLVHKKDRVTLIDRVLSKYKLRAEELLKILTTYVDNRKPDNFSNYFATILLSADLDSLASEFVEDRERKEKKQVSKKLFEKAMKVVDSIRINKPHTFREIAQPIADRWNYDLTDGHDKSTFDYMIETQEPLCMMLYKQFKDIEVLV